MSGEHEEEWPSFAFHGVCMIESWMGSVLLTESLREGALKLSLLVFFIPLHKLIIGVS